MYVSYTKEKRHEKAKVAKKDRNEIGRIKRYSTFSLSAMIKLSDFFAPKLPPFFTKSHMVNKHSLFITAEEMLQC